LADPPDRGDPNSITERPSGKAPLSPHRGPAHGSPHPVSRLAPAFQGGELAAEVAKAEAMLSALTAAKLRVIADQIQSLQQAARQVLADAREEQALNRARCAFKRLPGKVYHLYRRTDGVSYWSLLSPGDWRGRPPHAFLGSFRLESDYSWTAAEPGAGAEGAVDLVSQLLRIGDVATESTPSG